MFEKAVKNMQLFKVRETEIQKAEERMKVRFPDDLLYFYREYGCGFVNNEFHAVNRLMDPGSCALIRLREDYYECDPDLEMYEEAEETALIFFESGVNLFHFAGNLLTGFLLFYAQNPGERMFTLAMLALLLRCYPVAELVAGENPGTIGCSTSLLNTHILSEI